MQDSSRPPRTVSLFPRPCADTNFLQKADGLSTVPRALLPSPSIVNAAINYAKRFIAGVKSPFYDYTRRSPRVKTNLCPIIKLDRPNASFLNGRRLFCHRHSRPVSFPPFTTRLGSGISLAGVPGTDRAARCRNITVFES